MNSQGTKTHSCIGKRRVGPLCVRPYRCHSFTRTKITKK
jgi:hypothetical protein